MPPQEAPIQAIKPTKVKKEAQPKPQTLDPDPDQIALELE